MPTASTPTPSTPSVSAFLQRLDFLSPEQRRILAEADLDEPAAFRHYGPDFFVAPPFGFTPGKAGKLIAAVREADASSTAVAGPRRSEIDGLLAALEDRTARDQAARRLRAFGVDRTVVDEEGATNGVVHSAFVEDGSPVGPWYGKWRVVRVEDVGSKHPHHPRTGERLTRGDAVQWIQMTRDELVAAAAIFAAPDVLAGESDRAVFADVQAGGPMSETIRVRLAADRATRERAEAVVDGERVAAAPRPDQDEPATPSTGNVMRDLPALFARMFDEGGLRRFISYGPEGGRITGNLPGGNVPFNQLAFTAADILRRWGLVDADLRNRLIAERPRRADEIRRVFESLGVY